MAKFAFEFDATNLIKKLKTLRTALKSGVRSHLELAAGTIAAEISSGQYWANPADYKRLIANLQKPLSESYSKDAIEIRKGFYTVWVGDASEGGQLDRATPTNMEGNLGYWRIFEYGTYGRFTFSRGTRYHQPSESYHYYPTGQGKGFMVSEESGYRYRITKPHPGIYPAGMYSTTWASRRQYWMDYILKNFLYLIRTAHFARN